MSADELEKLRSESAQADALAALRADLAAVDADLKRLDDPGLGPPSAVLFYRRYYQREREKIMLRIDLLELPRMIEASKRKYEVASSPGMRLQHEKRCRMIQQGRAIGRSKETSLPPYPEVAAHNSLTAVLEKLEGAELRLQELIAGDAKWAEFLHTTTQPVLLATVEKAGAQDEDGAAKLNASEAPAVAISAPAPGVGLPLVDMRKPASTIAKETKRAALARGSPYREVPHLDRILKAVTYKKTAGCTYKEASISEFGNPDWADKIRYWHNKHSHGEP